MGAALQPTIRQGGTAGSRLLQSWKRKGKRREDFDLVNAVQCHPGNDGARDLPPREDALERCAGRLATIIRDGSYSRLVTLGAAATNAAKEILSREGLKIEIRECIHPNGGATRKMLDSLW